MIYMNTFSPEFIPANEYKSEEKGNIFILVDMDYFFAAAEIARNKELKGKPLAIIHSVGEKRGVVLTSTYDARELGIKSGTPLVKAKQLGKDKVTFIEADINYYRELSKKIFSFLSGFAPLEQVSIDEGYLILNTTWDNAKDIAESIQAELKEKFDIPCSIGISYNRILAKMACEAAKPGGIKVVKRNEAKEFLKDMKIEKLYGVGKKTAEQLKSLGINYVKDLWNFDPSKLREILGKNAAKLLLISKGEDPFKYSEKLPKGISTEKTLPEDTIDKDSLIPLVYSMCLQLSQELEANNLLAKTISVKVIYYDFENRTLSKTLNHQTCASDEIFNAAKDLLEKLLVKKIRKVGVRVSNIVENKNTRLI